MAGLYTSGVKQVSQLPQGGSYLETVGHGGIVQNKDTTQVQQLQKKVIYMAGLSTLQLLKTVIKR